MSRAELGPDGVPAGVPVVATAFGAPARGVLRDLVARAQAADPLAPVTVAVPSPYAGLALRRDLGRRRGLVNVRFLPLARVAELLGAPALADAGRVPLTAARRVEAVHAALAADPGPFAAVAATRATDDGLAATFAELRGVAPSALATLAARGPGPAGIVALYERFLTLTRFGYDEHDLARAATTAVAGGASLDELGRVIVYLPRRLTVAEASLLQALAAAGRVTVVAADDRLPPAPAPALLAAPDPEDEARAVVRRLLARAEAGTALGRMAILFPVGEPYARLVPELLDGAGVPWNGPSPTRLADTIVGRILTGVVDLVDADFARDAVAAWLAAGPVLDGGRRVPAARWDLVSRAAGVVTGADQWAARLEHYARELDAELAATDDDAADWHVGRLERDRDQARRLLAFVDDLVARARPPEPPGWAALAGWARDLLAHFLGGEGRRGDWPDPELEAARRIDDALGELATLDELGNPAGIARFRAALDAALDAPGAHVGRFGTGVFVGPLHAAYAADFDVVAVLGGAEGTLPPHGREDPFLSDADRAAAGLVTTSARRGEQRRDYVAALAGAEAALVSFPRADPRAQQSRLPARWLLDVASGHAGRLVSAEQLRDSEPAPWLEVVASFEAGVVRDAEPGSLVERDLRALTEWRDAGRAVADHPLAEGALGRGYALAARRASAAFTAADGNVGPSTGRGEDGRPIGATTLQDWAVCPFRYLLGRVLRVRELPRPEAADTIRPLEEGTLIHSILERFVRERPPSSPSQAWDERDRARMAAIVDACCDDAEARGVTGRPLLWRFARRRIERSALRFLDIDAARRRERDAAPAADGLELAFGIGGQPGVVVPRPGSEPVTFRGRIDRVDRSPDGTRVVVYDYKSGNPDRYPRLDQDPVDAGRLLQLPVYALAAVERTGARHAEAYYWFTRAAAVEDAFDGFVLDAPVRARFDAVVNAIVDGVEQGCFPAYPGEPTYDPRGQRETFDHCFSCPYDRLCPLDRGAAWARKAGDPALDPFWALEAETDRAP